MVQGHRGRNAEKGSSLEGHGAEEDSQQSSMLAKCRLWPMPPLWQKAHVTKLGVSDAIPFGIPPFPVFMGFVAFRICFAGCFN